MKYLLIRHGQTDANRLNRALYGEDGAPLNALGRASAARLAEGLKSLGIDVSTVKVASSELLRSQQTASYAGITETQQILSPLLNEVNTANPLRTQELVGQGKVPEEALAAARALLANPPKETVWFTHGLLIAAVREVLGLPGFVPDFCGIATIEL